MDLTVTKPQLVDELMRLIQDTHREWDQRNADGWDRVAIEGLRRRTVERSGALPDGYTDAGAFLAERLEAEFNKRLVAALLTRVAGALEQEG